MSGVISVLDSESPAELRKATLWEIIFAEMYLEPRSIQFWIAKMMDPWTEKMSILKATAKNHHKNVGIR